MQAFSKRFKNITGAKYGRLTALKPLGPKPKRKDRCIWWQCQCDSGNTIEVSGNKLRSGNTRSCGCLRYGHVLYGRDLKKLSPDPAPKEPKPGIDVPVMVNSSGPEVYFNKDGKPVTSSLGLARVFVKQHQHVTQAIEVLECSADFNAANFRFISYRDSRNRKRKAYELTRDGFTFLAMGFTGKRAA